MAPRHERRAQLLDAAIDIVADRGLGGLTHRAIDDHAGLPTGTTSNYFRTRLALLEATAAHTAQLHWHHVEAVQLLIGAPITRDGVVDLLTRLVSNTDPQYRRRTLARFELFLEGTRTPQLQPFLDELQHSAVRSARVVLEAAGIAPSDAQLDALTSVLNGLLFSTITFAPAAADPRTTIEQLLAAILK